MKKILLIIIGSLLLTACGDNFIEKQSEASKECWFAAYDSAKAGRFDLVAKYLEQGIQLVGVPSKRIKINGLIDPITRVSYMVVGDEFANFKLIVVGSNDFNKLLQYKQIAAQYKNDNTNLQKTNKEIVVQAAINKQIQDELLKKYNQDEKELIEYHNSLEYRIKSFFSNLISWGKWLIPLGGAGLVILCIMNPIVLPAVLSIGGTLFGILIKIFNIGLEIISNIFSLFLPKSSV